MKFPVEFISVVRTEPRGLRLRTARPPRPPSRRSGLSMDICSALEAAGRACRVASPQPLPGRELNGADQSASGSAVADFVRVTVNPARDTSERSGAGRSMSERPEPPLTRVDGLEAAAERPPDEGGVSRDTGASSAGTFTGRESTGSG